MPITLGLASSHAPSIHANTADEWERIYTRLKRNVPQPESAARETTEVLDDWTERVDKGFLTLANQLKADKTDLLILVGGDQNEMFDRSNVPQLMVYMGEEAWGQDNRQSLGEPITEDTLVKLKVDVETSRQMLNRLVTEEGFDVGFSTIQSAMGARAERGTPHAFITIARELMPELDIPVIMIYENTYDPPSLSAKRCYDLGRALARIFRDDPRRIAIYGSGGLSHDPGGPRSGWVDDSLDTWFMDQLAAGKGTATHAMYQFDSMTMRGGTGEMRSWITVSGALEEMGAHGNKVDYLPASHAVTGLGWMYWNVPERVAVGD